MEFALSPQELFLRFGAAMLCGLLIGLDREMKHKTVGVRAYLLVCLGAAGFATIVIEMTHYYIQTYDDVGPDPTRVLQGIVTGIGFLGGGAIMQAKGQITGVATGASIWVCGAIGVACGFGFYLHAVILTGYAFIVLSIIGVIRAKCRDDIESDQGDTPNNPAED